MPSSDAPCTLRPSKILENADKLMEQARALYESHKPIIKPTNRAMTEDKMTLASEYRRGVEGKSWLAQVEQAKLYLNRAQEALENVKRCVDASVDEFKRRKQAALVSHSGSYA